MCFAETGGPVERVTDQAVEAARRHFERRVKAVRAIIVEAERTSSAEEFEGAIQAGIVALAAIWTPDALGALLAQAMEVAALEGREAVFSDADNPTAFADIDLRRQEFREQIDFLTQKRPKPTRSWTDAMHGDHDRAFVVAGVTDMAMLEEFQAAIIAGAKTYDRKAFAAEFDRLVEKYGWSYNGGREWRIRTIFETNIRTSYMAGQLRQMRDPDMVKLLPYWMYIHAESRVPLNPRPQHVVWNRMVLRWDDPWWDIFFPPNDWLCSCGVRAISESQMRRMGKTEPDTAPKVPMRNVLNKITGETVQVPQGVGLGWDYMPGDRWERGLVPSALIEDPAASLTNDAKGQHLVRIDQAEPIQDLVARAVPFKAQVMAQGLPPEDYVRAFLEPFGATPGRAVLWQDAAGAWLPISDELFRHHTGVWKGGKRGHFDHAALLAEAIREPDEIWLGVREVPDPAHEGYVDQILTRRYIKVDPVTALFTMFEVGRRAWRAITGYASYNRAKADHAHIDRQRVGKLVWKRK